MTPITRVNFTYENRTLELLYERTTDTIYFNKCIVDKNIEFNLNNIWINDQPAEFLKKFTSALIDQSDLSHFTLNEEGVHLYFKNSNNVPIKILNQSTNEILSIHLDLDLEVKSLKKILKISSKISLFNNKGYRLLNDYTFKECGIKQDAQLIVKYHLPKEIDSKEDASSETDENDFDPEIAKLMNPPKVLKPKLNVFLNGLNLSGVCSDLNCNTSGHQITIPKEFGIFKMNTVYQMTECPQCKTKLFNINKFFFNGCAYSAEGTLKNGKVVHLPLKEVPRNKTNTFTEGSMNTWKDLTIIVQELPIKKPPSFPTTTHYFIGGAALLLAGYLFYRLNKDTKY